MDHKICCGLAIYLFNSLPLSYTHHHHQSSCSPIFSIPILPTIMLFFHFSFLPLHFFLLLYFTLLCLFFLSLSSFVPLPTCSLFSPPKLLLPTSPSLYLLIHAGHFSSLHKLGTIFHPSSFQVFFYSFVFCLVSYSFLSSCLPFSPCLSSIFFNPSPCLLSFLCSLFLTFVFVFSPFFSPLFYNIF